MVVDRAGPPTATLDGSFASYYDERFLVAATDPTGAPVLPARYSYGAQSKAALGPGSDAYKASTRLGWATAPTAAVVETTNPDNVPVLRFRMVFDANTNAPITSARFSIAISCTSCSLPPATGDLWASSQSSNTWLLPLSSNVVPPLALLPPGAAQLAITLTLQNAAGTTATAGPFQVNFHVVGPPLVMTEDTAYPSYLDPKSTYPYKLVNQTYGALWDVNNASFSGGQVRLLRYVIMNSAPTPVAVRVDYTQALSGSWSANERWDGVGLPRYTPPVFTGNFTAPDNCSLPAGISRKHGLPWLLGGVCPDGQMIRHVIGVDCAVAPFGCTDQTNINYASGMASVVTGPITPALFTGPFPTAGEVVSPRQLGTLYVIPAATETGPGTLVLYLTRSASLARSSPLAWGNDFGGAYYQRYLAEYWLYFDTTTVYDRFQSYRVGQVLRAASEHVAGAVVLVSQGTSGDALVGEARAVQTSSVGVAVTLNPGSHVRTQVSLPLTVGAIW